MSLGFEETSNAEEVAGQIAQINQAVDASQNKTVTMVSQAIELS